MLLNEMQTHIHQLALRIADEAARMDIETKCPSFTNDGCEPITIEEIRSAWYDISMTDIETADLIQLAVGYLTLRGKVVHHPLKKNWMRIVP